MAAAIRPAAGGASRMRLLELEARLAATRSAVVCAFHQMLDLKDLDTGCHSTRLAEWGVRVAEELGMEEALFQAVEVSALLHDIGKMGVPDAILQKPGALTDEEYALLKRHSEYGWAILRLIPGFEAVSHFVLHHHERMDGRGYPAGLRGEEIPMGARVIAVIDAFDAMVSDRPYRRGLGGEEALRRLQEAAGSQFDRRVVASFSAFASVEMATVAAAAS
ncbi:MAG: HD-GYP domain-containing protein [Terriglobales bacterium]